MADAPGIGFQELLEYQQEQTELWREYFLKRPHLLKLDASPTSTIGNLLFHTFTAEYRIAQRLLGEMMTEDAEFTRGNVSDIFSIAELAHIKFREYLERATPQQIATVQKFPSPTLGQFQATPRKLLMHAIVHTIRHWAQLARALREHGQRPDFSHDVLFSKRLR